MSKIDLLKSLNYDLSDPSKRVIAFIGAGISRGKPTFIPSWLETFEHLCEKAKTISPIHTELIDNYLLIVRKSNYDPAFLTLCFYKIRSIMGKVPYEISLKEILTPQSVDAPESLLKILQIPFTGIITTNIDNLIEKANRVLYKNGLVDKLFDINVYYKDAVGYDRLARDSNWLWKIHGTIDESNSWIFTSEEYSETIYGNKKYKRALTTIFQSARIVFFGFNGSDIDIDPIFEILATEYGGRKDPHLLVVKNKPYHVKKLLEKNIEIIEYDGNDHSSLFSEVIEKLPFISVSSQNKSQAGKTKILIQYIKKLKREISDIRINLSGEEIQQYVFPLFEIFSDVYLKQGYSNWNYYQERGHPKEKIFNLLKKSKSSVVLGSPGTGKSTLLKYIAMDAITKNNIPILINIEDFLNEHYINSDLTDFIQIIEKYFVSYNTRITRKQIESLLYNGKIVILIDGLELISDDVLKKLLKLYNNFQKKWEKLVIVIASRRNTYSTISNFSFLKLFEIDKNELYDIKSITYKYLAVLLKDKNKRYIEQKQDELIHIILESDKLSEIATNTSMLTFLILLYHNNKITKEVESGRVQFLNSVISWLLASQKNILNIDLWDLYSKLALRMCEYKNKKTSKLGQHSIIDIILKNTSYGEIQDIQDIINNSGVLETKNGNISFWHLWFQEYLAAHEIAQLGNNIKTGWWYYVRKYIQNIDWEEIICFLPECLMQSGEDHVDLFYERLAKYAESLDVFDKFEVVSFGCSTFNKVIVSNYTPNNILSWGKIVTNMSNVIFSGIDNISLNQKINISACYGNIGDKRLDDFDQTFVRFEGGDCQYSVINLDNFKCSYSFKKITVHNFDMRKYLITNLEFESFIFDQGYSNDIYWSSDGWAWKEKEKIEYPLNWHEQRFLKNYPVTGISLFEANAFCMWLNLKYKHSGYIYRLPYDEEWEYVITSNMTNSQLYNWGDTIESGMNAQANWAGCEVRQKTPIGMFPKSTTEVGITDLIGNIEEWCGTKNYKPFLIDENKAIVRGGSTIRYSRLCHARYRSQSNLRNRYMTIGFRITRTEK